MLSMTTDTANAIYRTNGTASEILTESPYCQMPSIYTSLHEKYGDLMRTDAVAKELGCHAAHVRKMCQRGDLPGVQVGNRWIIPTAKLAALLDGEADEMQL